MNSPRTTSLLAGRGHGLVIDGIVALALGALAASAFADEPTNYFNDPFFPIASAIAACPEPLGPRITEVERLAQSHYRVERGTSCWLAGTCSRPNAYLYDADIARALQASLAAGPRWQNASLWVTVQRRFIYVEGCVAAPADADQIAAFMRAIPDVEQVIVNVYTGPPAKPTYATLH